MVESKYLKIDSKLLIWWGISNEKGLLKDQFLKILWTWNSYAEADVFANIEPIFRAKNVTAL